jgi:hypothetical protein
MQFATRGTILECSFAKRSHGSLGIKWLKCIFYIHFRIQM